MLKINIPLSVPANKRAEYQKNYRLATNNSGHLLLFAGDQKVEHLNDDFFGTNIDKEDASPEHLFKIAKGIPGSLLAAQLGLLSRYGGKYKDLPFLVKINGKSNLGQNEEKDSSSAWWNIEDVVNFKKDSKLAIVGIGYTVYLGGKYEAKMLKEAASLVYKAHQNGLIAVIWMYPRGKGINEEDIHTIAGGAGMAACLDADFVKLKYPHNKNNAKLNAEKYKEAVLAAGETKIICVGGSMRNEEEMIKTTKEQLDISKTWGLAIGRNLHQRSLKDAIILGKKLSKLIHRR